MHLTEQLAALERRCEREAPQLRDDVRRLRATVRELTAISAPDLASPASAVPDRPADDTSSEVLGVPGGDPGRYLDLGLIGMGGMGEVRRVRDHDLNRVLAMKVIQESLTEEQGSVLRFVEEAQATAQLQHPGIVPVHEIGRLADGRAYFTMTEVLGRTFSEAISDGHASPAVDWMVELRRLVGTLHQASLAVAYAHARGVVHRDLKPDNIMVGSFGEVFVMDWGLAKVRGRPDLPAAEGDLDAVITDRSRDSAAATRVGTVSGTPAYMSPEQARGELERIDARSDVYALGSILYEVLTGRPPYEGGDARSVWKRVLGGPPEPLTRAAQGLPAELVAACERAMAREASDRFDTAIAFAAALTSWLDGARRREQALAVVELADATGPRADGLRARAEALAAQAEALLSDVPSWAPEHDKVPGWAREEEAEALVRAAELEVVRREQLLQGALTIAPELAEAHAGLAEMYRRRHAVAEARQETGAMAKAEVQLRRHVEALPAAHEVRRGADAYLDGRGLLTLVTEPPGAEVMLHRYERYHKRLVEVPLRSLGRTPLRELPLPMGSYLCLLRHPECAEVRYPVRIGRGEHWHGTRPGGTDAYPVELPRPGELGLDDLFVPAGWFGAGDRGASRSAPLNTRLWCDAFVMRRFPVTNAEYIEFLDDLVDRGREDDALRWAPRERAGHETEPGAEVYGRDARGHFELVVDAEGDQWLPDNPVLMVDWDCANAYAAWLAARTGQPWRLAREFEWEKAARGVDGRRYPWGNDIDGSFCCYRASHPARPTPFVVDSFPLDVSPYGVRGLGGNVTDWCADRFANHALPADQIVPTSARDAQDGWHLARTGRGGGWFGNEGFSNTAFREAKERTRRDSSIGFRLARSWNQGSSPLSP